MGAVLVGTLLAGQGVAGAAPPTGIRWTPCAEDTTAECGTVRVPVDWARPAGETFDLALARRKADPAKRIGALLVNPGGPGGSGVDSVLHEVSTTVGAEVRAGFDIVGFDPRGIGRSSPIRCSQAKVDAQPSLYPRNQAEFTALTTYNRELHDDCRRHSGAIVDHADTASVVQDMDAVRRALGESKINYYGISYGTLIGQQYAERYGDRIRAMVLDSNLDHSLTMLPMAWTASAAIEDSFTEFVKWCDHALSCGLHGQDVREVWSDLLDRADRGEVRDPRDPAKKLTMANLTAQAGGAFYDPDWTQLADMIISWKGQATPGYGTVNQPNRSIICDDFAFPVHDYQEYAAVRDVETSAAPNMRGGYLGHTSFAGCLGWDDHVNNPQRTLNIRQAPKILMLTSVHDPATSYTWALNAHRQSRDTTVLMTYDGWGHGVYTRTDCTRGTVDRYLISQAVPADGTHCPAG